MTNLHSAKNIEFSICLACYNGEIYIKDQLLSILAQMSAEDELVISDNGSKDKTIEIIESLQDVRIKVLNCLTVGVAKNFENCLLNAAGKYIVLCDQDDIWLEGRLDAARTALNSCDLSVVGMLVVNENLEPINVDLNLRYPSTSFIKTLYSNGFSGCCLAFQRDILNIILPFPNELLIHDWWIALNVILHNKKITFNENKFILYRRHSSNASKTTIDSDLSIINKFYIRLLILFFLLIRYLNFLLRK